VYGARPTPYESLARLSNQLGAGGARDELFTGLASAVADGVGAAEVTLWVGSEDELVAVASWPPSSDHELAVESRDLASLGAGGRTHVRPIVHRGTLRGAVTLTEAPGEVLTAADDRLLRDLVAQAGLVVDNVGLGAELQHRLHEVAAQAAELRAAATRTVAAQYEARRQIERDLHDGAQQSFVCSMMTLRAAERRLAGDPAGAAALLRTTREHLERGLEDLRDLARGIHPALLADHGVAAALGGLAARATVPVVVHDGLDGRLAPEIEAALYFCGAEAITNAAKHADATEVVVRVGRGDGDVFAEVVDDGVGGAALERGSGLRGLVDRIGTVGGDVRVISSPGAGTRVIARVPMPA